MNNLQAALINSKLIDKKKVLDYNREKEHEQNLKEKADRLGVPIGVLKNIEKLNKNKVENKIKNGNIKCSKK